MYMYIIIYKYDERLLKTIVTIIQ